SVLRLYDRFNMAPRLLRHESRRQGLQILELSYLRDRLAHPGRRQLLPLSREQYFNHSRASFQLEQIHLYRSAQYPGGTQDRVPGKRQLRSRGEDPEARMAALSRRKEEHRLTEIHLTRDRL